MVTAAHSRTDPTKELVNHHSGRLIHSVLNKALVIVGYSLSNTWT